MSVPMRPTISVATCVVVVLQCYLNNPQHIKLVLLLLLLLPLLLLLLSFYFITGPPTHSVGGPD